MLVLLVSSAKLCKISLSHGIWVPSSMNPKPSSGGTQSLPFFSIGFFSMFQLEVHEYRILRTLLLQSSRQDFSSKICPLKKVSWCCSVFWDIPGHNMVNGIRRGFSLYLGTVTQKIFIDVNNCVEQHIVILFRLTIVGVSEQKKISGRFSQTMFLQLASAVRTKLFPANTFTSLQVFGLFSSML